MKSSRKQRKTFSKEFKTDAVNRSCRVGIRQTCLDLEIGESTLQRNISEQKLFQIKIKTSLPSIEELEAEFLETETEKE